MLIEVADAEREAAALVYAKRMADALNKHYPGRAWAVNVDQRGGVATVQDLSLPGQWGFVMKMNDIQHDASDRRVMRAGGELLEAFRVSRSGEREGDYAHLNPFSTPDR